MHDPGTTGAQEPASGAPRSRWPRGLVPAALKLIGWSALVYVLVLTDQYTRQAYQSALGQTDALLLPAYFLTGLLKLRPVLLLVLLLLVVDRRLRWRFPWELGIVAVVQSALASAAKHLFNRARPDSPLGAGIFGGPFAEVEGRSFPSGHAASAFALAAVFAAYYPRWRWVFYLGAGAVCLARVHLDAHYFGDVVAGAVLGWYLARGLLAWLRRSRRIAATDQPSSSTAAAPQ
jgi:membrane-associated phospholipid phosphatase